MTLIVTHAAGFLACFTRNPDGSLKQRALIDTGEEPPTAIELAELGERFAREYGWNGAKVSMPRVKVAKGKPAKALPTKRSYNRSDPPTAERNVMIIEYLATHPSSAVVDIITGLGFEHDRYRYGRWSFHLNNMVKSGILKKAHGRGRYGKSALYSVAD